MIRYSPDGRNLATASEDGQIKVWDGAEAMRGEPQVIPDHRGWAFSVAFSPDGRWLATGGWGIVHLWDTALGRPAGRIGGFPKGVDALAFGPDSETLAVTTSAGQPSKSARFAPAGWSPPGRRTNSEQLPLPFP